MLKGIDVSHWQSVETVNTLCKDPNNKFIIVKASEGLKYKDPKFTAHITTARMHDKLTGAYHFARCDVNWDSAKKEADHFIDVCDGYWGQIIPVLDIEGNAAAWDKTGEWSLAWLERVFEVTGLRGVIYCGTSYAKKCQEHAHKGYHLWLARWVEALKASHFGAFSECLLWQYTNKPVDQDYFYGTEDEWKRLCMPSKTCETCGKPL